MGSPLWRLTGEGRRRQKSPWPPCCCDPSRGLGRVEAWGGVSARGLQARTQNSPA